MKASEQFYRLFSIVMLGIIAVNGLQLYAQDPERDSIMHALKTIDPEIVRYFPLARLRAEPAAADTANVYPLRTR